MDIPDKYLVINQPMKPGTPPLKSTRLLDQMRERIRYMHYSLSTENVYLYWVRFFIRWHGREGQMQHPRDIGALGVKAFLTMLATERKVSASTHNQALSAVLFLYREPLGLRRCHQSAKEVAVQRGEVLYLDRAVIVANVQLKTDYGVTGACCTKR